MFKVCGVFGLIIQIAVIQIRFTNSQEQSDTLSDIPSTTPLTTTLPNASHVEEDPQNINATLTQTNDTQRLAIPHTYDSNETFVLEIVNLSTGVPHGDWDQIWFPEWRECASPATISLAQYVVNPQINGSTTVTKTRKHKRKRKLRVDATTVMNDDVHILNNISNITHQHQPTTTNSSSNSSATTTTLDDASNTSVVIHVLSPCELLSERTLHLQHSVGDEAHIAECSAFCSASATCASWMVITATTSHFGTCGQGHRCCVIQGVCTLPATCGANNGKSVRATGYEKSVLFGVTHDGYEVANRSIDVGKDLRYVVGSVFICKTHPDSVYPVSRFILSRNETNTHAVINTNTNTNGDAGTAACDVVPESSHAQPTDGDCGGSCGDGGGGGGSPGGDGGGGCYSDCLDSRTFSNATTALGARVHKNEYNITLPYVTPHWLQSPWRDERTLPDMFAFGLTTSSLDTFLSASSTQHSLVFVHSYKCPFSAAAAPLLLMLYSDFPTLHIRFIDGENNSQVINRYALAGYPTVLLFRGSKIVARLQSPADHMSLVSFVETKLKIKSADNGTSVQAGEGLQSASRRCVTALHEALHDGDVARAIQLVQALRLLSWYSNGNEEGLTNVRSQWMFVGTVYMSFVGVYLIYLAGSALVTRFTQ